jgi:hypothetical protein
MPLLILVSRTRLQAQKRNSLAVFEGFSDSGQSATIAVLRVVVALKSLIQRKLHTIKIIQ